MIKENLITTNRRRKKKTHPYNKDKTTKKKENPSPDKYTKDQIYRTYIYI